MLRNVSLKSLRQLYYLIKWKTKGLCFYWPIQRAAIKRFQDLLNLLLSKRDSASVNRCHIKIYIMTTNEAERQSFIYFFFFLQKKKICSPGGKESDNDITQLRKICIKKIICRFEFGTLPCDHRNIRNGRKFSPLNFK